VSNKVLNDVWERDIPSSRKLVLVCLADIADDKGQCWPSQETIGGRCGMAVRTVHGHLVRLERDGHIERRRRFQNSTVYKIVDVYRQVLAQDRQDTASLRLAGLRLRLATSGTKTGNIPPVNPYEPSLEPSLSGARTKKTAKPKAAKQKRFTPPDLNATIAYFLELKSTKLEAEKFHDYFTGNGWKTGRVSLKDWKAAARNWVRRAPEFEPRHHKRGFTNDMPTYDDKPKYTYKAKA